MVACLHPPEDSCFRCDGHQELYEAAVAVEEAFAQISGMPDGEIGPSHDPVWTMDMWRARNKLREAIGLDPFPDEYSDE